MNLVMIFPMRWISGFFILVSLFLGAHSWAQKVAISSLQQQWIVSENSAAQRTIDQAFHRILLTPSGLAICIIAQGHPDLLNHLVGVSSAASTQIAAECIAKARAHWGADMIRYGVLSKNSENLMKQRPKKTYWIVPSETYFPYDSWTTLENQTLISEKAMQSPELFPVLIHELQMAFDAKDSMSQNNIEILEEGWAVFSRSFWKSQVDRDVRQTLETIHATPLRRILGIVRSFSYEQSVLDEMRSGTEEFSPGIFSDKACVENVEMLMAHFRGDLSAGEMKELRQAWVLVKESHIGFEYPSRGIGQISFCQFMSIPAFGINTHLTSGPRPRIRPSSSRETLINGGLDRGNAIKSKR